MAIRRRSIYLAPLYVVIRGRANLRTTAGSRLLAPSYGSSRPSPYVRARRLYYPAPGLAPRYYGGM